MNRIRVAVFIGTIKGFFIWLILKTTGICIHHWRYRSVGNTTERVCEFCEERQFFVITRSKKIAWTKHKSKAYKKKWRIP